MLSEKRFDLDFSSKDNTDNDSKLVDDILNEEDDFKDPIKENFKNIDFKINEKNNANFKFFDSSDRPLNLSLSSLLLDQSPELRIKNLGEIKNICDDEIHDSKNVFKEEKN